MTETNARQPQGIPVGGQFAPTFHAEPGFGLGSPAPAVSVPFHGSVELHNNHFGNLPPLPASVGTPEVTFDFNVDGKLETHVTVDGSKMSFWNDDMADQITNTVESGRVGEDDAAPWSGIAEYEEEQTRAWAESVHERIHGATLDVLISAVDTNNTRASIINFAAGRGETVVEPTPEQASAKRAVAALAVTEEGQGIEVTMRDLFTDLRHYADARGIDIHNVLDESFDYYRHEKQDPAFKETH